MEMVLTGDFIDAQRAYEVGLVNKVVPVELYLSETVNVAKKIAAKSPIAVRMAKESVLQSFQSSLDDGLMYCFITTPFFQLDIQEYLQRLLPSENQ